MDTMEIVWLAVQILLSIYALYIILGIAMLLLTYCVITPYHMITDMAKITLIVLFSPYFFIKKSYRFFNKITSRNKKIQYANQYKPKDFMTHNERKFFYALNTALGGSYHIMAQVRVADVITPDGGESSWGYLFNRIKSKHFDFILLDKRPHKNLSIACAIELDDKSHTHPKRIERDDFINEACQTANICLIRYPGNQKFYKPQELSSYIKKELDSFNLADTHEPCDITPIAITP